MHCLSFCCREAQPAVFARASPLQDSVGLSLRAVVMLSYHLPDGGSSITCGVAKSETKNSSLHQAPDSQATPAVLSACDTQVGGFCLISVLMLRLANSFASGYHNSNDTRRLSGKRLSFYDLAPCVRI